MKIKNYFSAMQDENVMFLETVKQATRRRRGIEKQYYLLWW